MSKYIPNAFQVPNAVIDEYMANLSGTAFKCYMLITRKTTGWQKELDYIPVSQFLSLCGVKKHETIAMALNELEKIGLIIRIQSKGKVTGYKLNLFMETTPENGVYTKNGTTPENGGDPPPKMGGASTPENGGTSKPTTKPINTKPNIKEKYKKEKNQKTEKHRLPDDWVLSEKNRQYAKEIGFDDSFISLLAEGFADYWHSEDAKNPFKSDWDSTWRNHVRDRKMRGYVQVKTHTSSNDDDIFKGCVNYG